MGRPHAVAALNRERQMVLWMGMKADWRLAGAAALGVSLAACDVKIPGVGEPAKKPEARGEIEADIDVKIAEDDAGDYAFSCAGVYTDADCNLDFRAGDAAKSAVRIVFRIDPGSADGVRFFAEGTQAMYIAFKQDVGEDSPKSPYNGRQFADFKTSDDGLQFSVLNQNDDGEVYRYALRFERDGEPVVYDPDLSNSGGEN
jgi:hypothetical protein